MRHLREKSPTVLINIQSTRDFLCRPWTCLCFHTTWNPRFSKPSLCVLFQRITWSDRLRTLSLKGLTVFYYSTSCATLRLVLGTAAHDVFRFS